VKDKRDMAAALATLWQWGPCAIIAAFFSYVMHAAPSERIDLGFVGYENRR
jgi:hypothetical protein